MKYKTLIIIANSLFKPRYLDDALERVTQFFQERFGGDFEFEIVGRDGLRLSLRKGKKVPMLGGKSYKMSYYLNDTRPQLRKFVPRGKYHSVCLVFDGNEVYHNQGLKMTIHEYIPNYSARTPLYPETELLFLNAQTKTKTDALSKHLHHEMMHQFGNRIRRRNLFAYLAKPPIDQMDRTLVSGKWLSYYKERQPWAKDGNYAITTKNYQPYLKELFMLRDWEAKVPIGRKVFFFKPDDKPKEVKPDPKPEPIIKPKQNNMEYIHYSQKDPRWANQKLGTCNTTLRASGCFVTALAMQYGDRIKVPPTSRKWLESVATVYDDGTVEATPAILDFIFTKEKLYSSGCNVVSTIMAKRLGLEHNGHSGVQPPYQCIAETDNFKRFGVPQHFFVVLPDGRILDPLDPPNSPPKKNPYHIVSYRLVKTKKESFVEPPKEPGPKEPTVKELLVGVADTISKVIKKL